MVYGESVKMYKVTSEMKGVDTDKSFIVFLP